MPRTVSSGTWKVLHKTCWINAFIQFTYCQFPTFTHIHFKNYSPWKTTYQWHICFPFLRSQGWMPVVPLSEQGTRKKKALEENQFYLVPTSLKCWQVNQLCQSGSWKCGRENDSVGNIHLGANPERAVAEGVWWTKRNCWRKKCGEKREELTWLILQQLKLALVSTIFLGNSHTV